MFNLLRERMRRKQNKNKSKYNIEAVQSNDNVPKYSANKQTNVESTEQSREHYRQFIESDKHQQHHARMLPTAVVATANVGASITDQTTTTTTTTIEKGNDEENLENCLHVNDGKITKTAATNAGKIYFENASDNRRQIQQQQPPQRPNRDKLAKTTTKNCTKIKNNEDTTSLPVDADHEYQQLNDNLAAIEETVQHQRQRQWQRQRQKVEDVNSDLMVCGFSHNEPAEWQRRVLTIGENNEILKNRNTTAITETAENLINNNNNNNNLQAFNVNALSTSKTNNVVECQNVENKQLKSATTPTTTVNETPTTPTYNEVKYRNLDKSTSRNEAKRQSRLSFTLAGINFGRKKEVDERKAENEEAAANVKVSKAPVESYKTNLLQQQQQPEQQQQTNTDSNCKLERSKLGPLQKSREYLNGLFMARGRHHNRHQRHQQQQHQQQQQQQHQLAQEQNKNATHSAKSDSGIGGGGGASTGNLMYNQQHFRTTANSNTHNNLLPNQINRQSYGNARENTTSLHLDLNGDRATDFTNSYQIPLSKNSALNFQTIAEAHTSGRERERTRQRHVDHDERETLRSNSATILRAHSASPLPHNKRSRSVTFNDEVELLGEKTNVWLNNGSDYFSRTAHVELDGGISVKTANENFAQDNKRSNANTHGDGTVNTGAVPSAITSAYEDTYQHINQTTTLPTASRAADVQFDQHNNSNKNNNNNNNIIQYIQLNQIGNQSNASTRAPTPTPTLTMGQSQTKTDVTARDFRESSVTPETTTTTINNSGIALSSPINIKLPAITVADYSESLSSTPATPADKEVFYEADNSEKVHNNNERLNTMTVDNTVDDEHDAVFYDGATSLSSPSMHDQYSKWQTPNNGLLAQSQMRHSHNKLEDVREEDEDAEEAEEEEEEDEDDDEEESSEEEEAQRPRHLDNELYNSSERSPLKSSDTTLSGSPSDSGIGTDSQPTTPLHIKSRNSPTSFRPQTAPAATTTTTDQALNQQQKLKQQIKQQYSFMSFVRDGNSTDCDETPLPRDDIELDLADDDMDDDNPHARLVCIESISLPDVVVESTTASSSSTTLSSSSSTGENIININGATGNSVGNTHFIPIHVEGAANNVAGAKRRSVDDSVIGGGSIEITEDASVMNGFTVENRHAEKLKKELSDQKSRFNVQLEDAQKNMHSLQSKVNEMQLKIDKLEQELSAKAWNVERLQGELDAAQKDDDYVRKKLKLLEDEKTTLRHKYSENEDEFRRRYEEFEAQYQELEQKYKQTQHLASNLQTQLALAQSEAEEWRQEVEKIRAELEEQIRVLKNALDFSEAERKICADKWQREFEMLRNQHQDREESLMTDCEWQMRQMQKQCKDKIDKADFLRQESSERAARLEAELTERQRQVNHLKLCQAEVKSLRGVVTEQESSIRSLMTQIDNLKAELQAANDNLLLQIETVEKIKFQCNNALCDKERQMIYRIDEVRNEAAAFWEDKLYTEMTRLKNELESVYVDERREALDKLQDEHIEELRVLTNRYTVNEEELRVELTELQERLDQKNSEFLEMREKSDNALLQTRMHLDRADREYQNAMCREERRREELEEKLRKEFEEQKEQMEKKFQEHLSKVKAQYSKELQIAAQNLSEKHKKELEQQKLKLMAERDEALQELADRHRQKLADAEERMKDIELRHQRALKDLKSTYDTEKAALDKRDISNANEIEQLHRKCRCLTNLFEEMRMRYERRDPRPEDLREIAELRSRSESQERDLYLLTDRLREMQIQMSELQQNNINASHQAAKKAGKVLKKPPPKSIPTNCDVIYEENEERESPAPNDDDSEEEVEEQISVKSAQKVDSTKKKVQEINGKKQNNTINEDDSRMITSV